MAWIELAKVVLPTTTTAPHRLDRMGCQPPSLFSILNALCVCVCPPTMLGHQVSCLPTACTCAMTVPFFIIILNEPSQCVP